MYLYVQAIQANGNTLNNKTNEKSHYFIMHIYIYISFLVVSFFSG